MAKLCDGRVVIVTGAGRGIGREHALMLAAHGAKVVVNDLGGSRDGTGASKGPAEEVVHEIQAAGGTAAPNGDNVADFAGAGRMVKQALDTFGRLDAVVNNAGISRVGPHTQDVTDEDWHDSIAVMQTGVFFCMRAAGRIMIPQRSGSVINISSIRGFSPNAGRMTYCAPKAAVIMMTKVAAGEWAPHGVRVNAIAPGVLKTPMWDTDVARGAIDEPAILEVVPMHRLGLPSEVGKLAAFLASDDAAYITGAVLTIDGALTSIPAA